MNKNLTFVLVVIVAMTIAAAATAATLAAHKEHLNRDDSYYQIENDAGDHGNFIETYRIPVSFRDRRGSQHQGTVFCIVYSDQIGESGGGAGESCDWEGFHNDHPQARQVGPRP